MSLAHLHGIRREGVICVLEVTFYADETGIHDPHGEQLGSEVAAIAGYIATKEQWKKFERRWNTALRKFKVPEFHMSEYNREEPKPTSPYFGWSSAKKKRFLRCLIRIAVENTTYAYGSLVETKAWDRLLDNDTKLGLPKIRNGEIVEITDEYNPYTLLFQKFFASFLRILKSEIDPFIKRHGPPEDVAFVFHRHQRFGPSAQWGFDLIQRTFDQEDRLASITFGASSKYIPLQAADLLAFYARKHHTRQLKGLPADEFDSELFADRHAMLIITSENLKDLQENSEKRRRLEFNHDSQEE
jgi:hypothetical protein